MRTTAPICLICFLLLGGLPAKATGEDLPTFGGLRLSLGTGLSLFPYATGQPGSLQRQIEAVGMEMPLFGGIFDLTVECELLGWLVLGAEFDYHIHSGGSADGYSSGIRINPDLSPELSYEFHRLLGMAFVQGNFMGRHNVGDFEMGIRIAVGVGGLIWSMRGENEMGRIVEFRPGLVVGSVLGDWTLHGHIAFPLQWIRDVGPYELDYTGLTATVFEIKVGYRL